MYQTDLIAKYDMSYQVHPNFIKKPLYKRSPVTLL